MAEIVAHCVIYHCKGKHDALAPWRIINDHSEACASNKRLKHVLQAITITTRTRGEGPWRFSIDRSSARYSPRKSVDLCIHREGSLNGCQDAYASNVFPHYVRASIEGFGSFAKTSIILSLDPYMPAANLVARGWRAEPQPLGVNKERWHSHSTSTPSR